MIYTSAPTVKASSQWCAEADSLSEKLHAVLGARYGDEGRIDGVVLEQIGLANTLVVLGSPHPRCKKQAEQVLEAYLLDLYDVAKELCDKLGIEFVDLTNIINSPTRAAQRKQLCKTLRHLQYGSCDPVLDYLFKGLRFLLCEESNSIKALYAGKNILSAWKLVDSDEDVYGELVIKLTNLLESA
jgi:hypothetical protein